MPRTHRPPVSEPEKPRLGVEGDVAVWTFGVMVWAVEAAETLMEAAARGGDGHGGGEGSCGLGGAEGGAGDHLFLVSYSDKDVD